MNKDTNTLAVVSYTYIYIFLGTLRFFCFHECHALLKDGDEAHYVNISVLIKFSQKTSVLP